MDNPATPRQIRYLRALCREKPIDPDEFCVEHADVRCEALTRRRASELMDIIADILWRADRPRVVAN